MYPHSGAFSCHEIQVLLYEVLVIFFRHANLIPVTALGTGLQFAIHRGVWDDQLPLRFAACLEVACKFTPLAWACAILSLLASWRSRSARKLIWQLTKLTHYSRLMSGKTTASVTELSLYSAQ